MFKCLSVILFICSSALARSAGGTQFQNLISDTSPKEDFNQNQGKPIVVNNDNKWWNDASMLYKIFQQCNKDNLSVCLKIKLLLGLDTASQEVKEINLIDGIKFVKDDSITSNVSILSEKDIEKTLPRSLDDKEDTLNYLLLDKAISFIGSHTLQVKFPDSKEIARSLDEGRKKKDKKGQGAFIMIPLLLGGTFIPIAFGALALLAGKALIVSKLALVLASIIGIKKLLSGGGHKESQHEVVVSSGGHGGSGWGRDFDLAYNAHNPDNNTAKV